MNKRLQKTLGCFVFLWAFGGLVNPQAAAQSSASFAYGEAGRWAAGVVLGAPSALTAKHWKNTLQAYQFGLGYDVDRHVTVYGDHLWHFPEVPGQMNIEAQGLVPYIGVGGLVRVFTDAGPRNRDNEGRNIRILFRVPLGVEWMIPQVPLALFVELAPGVRILPNLTGEFGGGLGLRYYF